MASQNARSYRQMADQAGQSPDRDFPIPPRRRPKVHRSHSENIGRWRQQQQGVPQNANKKVQHKVPGRDEEPDKGDAASRIPDASSVEPPPTYIPIEHIDSGAPQGSVGAEVRDSGISLGAAGQPAPGPPAVSAPVPITYRDIFQPWERFMSHNTARAHSPSPLVDATGSPPSQLDAYVQSAQAKERLSGLLTVDRRGPGRYWWNGYKRSDSQHGPSDGKRGLTRTHSLNMGPRELVDRSQKASGHNGGDLAPAICHIRVTSDPGVLDPNLASHSFEPNKRFGHSTHELGPAYQGSGGVGYEEHSPGQLGMPRGCMTAGPTGGRYPSHGSNRDSPDLPVTTATHSPQKPPQVHKLRSPLVRLQSRSTDELSNYHHDKAADRMTQSLTMDPQHVSDGSQPVNNVIASRHSSGSSWQPLGWLTVKGRKLSGFLDRGRNRHSGDELSPDRTTRKEKASVKKSKPRSLSVERGMKLSRPADAAAEYDKVMLRSCDANRDISKRWCYVYQDNEGIKLGSLSKETKRKDEKDAKEDEEKTEVALSSEEYSLTKQVIIQRDERGYGLTVSGDNPVFVQSVKENGAAAKAGVQKGDRILKVNGTLVTKCNHKDVVKLIKSGSYVALTLLGRPSGHQVSSPTQVPVPGTPMSAQGQPPPQYPGVEVTSPMALGTPPGGAGEKTAISGPKAVNPQMDKELKMQKVSMIRFMYEKECEECEKLIEDLRQNPQDTAKQQKLEEKLRIRGQLGDQLYQLTGIPAESHISSPKSPPSGLPPPGGTYSTPPGAPRPPMKRYGSGDRIQYAGSENAVTLPQEEDTPDTTTTPWLPAGPKHRKADSMPEPFYHAELPPSGKTVTVSRSNSDSHKQRPGGQTDIADRTETASADDIEKLRGDIRLRRRKMMQKTSSLPSSVYETSSQDQSSNQNVTTSPMSSREVWEETSEPAMSPTDLESPNTTRGSGTSMSPPREIRPHLQVVSPLQADVIPMEEEEEVNMDDEHLEDHGPFSDLNRLKHKPAHLGVFLHYLISNSDPSPLLFYLVTEQYTQGSMKDLRRWAYEIYSTFLVPSAAIKVEDLDSSLLDSIEHTLLNRSDKEDIMRTVFQNVRHMAQKQISELLADFRQKRTLGLANLYGDNELSDNMERSAELKTVESKLLPHLEKCSSDTASASPRDKAMAWALATILKQLGVSPTKNSTTLERCQSFISKDKKPFKLGGRSNRKNGHQFNPTHYHSTVYCKYCSTLLWGIGCQGFQCSNCDINVHKSCMEQMQDVCSGRKKKEKRTSMLHMLRKTTNPNPAAIKEAQRIHDESNVPGHVTPPIRDSSLFHIRPSIKDEDEEDLVQEAQRLHEEKTNHHRALSMPSIRDAGANAGWKASTTQLTPTYPGPMRGHVTIEEDLESLRAGNKVTNLVEQYQQQQFPDDPRQPVTPPRGGSPDAMETEEQKRKNSTNLGRSESLNKKRESRRSVRRTRSDVQVDDQTLKSLNQSGSSSNSSLSNRSLDSPSTSAEALSDGHHPPLAVLQEDSDFEIESELPPLDSVIPKDQLKKLKKSEKKRQEVINELFYTERVHVKYLKVMEKIFRVPMISAFNDQEMVDTLFPGLDNLIEVHSKLNNRFKNTRKESCVVGKVADLLLSSFDGEAGEEFKTLCAKFCRDQSHALDYLKGRQRKDPKLANFIQEASSNPLCTRLELKDIIPKAMQRLTKYPLLIGSLLQETSKNSEEHRLLQKAWQCTRDLLNHVNQAVRDRENEHKLADIQRHLDRRGLDNSKYQSFELRDFRLIHDGALTWRISKQKQIQLHVLLLDQFLVLLQKQDDRYVLKYQSTGRDDISKSTHSPIIQLQNLMVRPVATDKRAMFLISDGDVGPQIYELCGNSTENIKRWFKYLSESTSDRQKKGKGSSDSSGPPSRPSSMLVPESSASLLTADPSPQNTADHAKNHKESSLYPKSKSHSLDGLEKIEHVEVHSVTDTVLAQPCEVVANTVQVNTAAPTLTPAERLKEQETLISSALVEKRSIVAEMLGIPVQDFTDISEMAADIEGEKEPRELILGALHQSSQLTCLVNTHLTDKSPEDATHVSSTSSTDQRETASSVSVDVANNNRVGQSHSTRQGSGHNEASDDGAGSSSTNHSAGKRTKHRRDVCVSLPSGPLLDITTKLQSQLHHLMEALADREKEQEKLQSDLREAQSQIKSLLDLRSPTHSLSHTSRPNSYISMTSSTSEDPELVGPAEVCQNLVVLHGTAVPNQSMDTDASAGENAPETFEELPRPTEAGRNSAVSADSDTDNECVKGVEIKADTTQPESDRLFDTAEAEQLESDAQVTPRQVQVIVEDVSSERVATSPDLLINTGPDSHREGGEEEEEEEDGDFEDAEDNHVSDSHEVDDETSKQTETFSTPPATSPTEPSAPTSIAADQTVAPSPDTQESSGKREASDDERSAEDSAATEENTV